MHVGGVWIDLNWFLQFVFTAFVIVIVLLYLVKNTASKYFEVDANFDSSRDVAVTGGDCLSPMPGIPNSGDAPTCAVCDNPGKSRCSGCKVVRYCSQACQVAHWGSGHKTKCKEFQVAGRVNLVESAATNRGRRSFGAGGNISLVPANGKLKVHKQLKKVLFPYDEFVDLFNWNKPGFPPCGLLNCGNSCFANVVLQCLTFTRPLVAYLLGKGHRKECRRNDWCFLCEFQTHIERTTRSLHPFSPINILSRLPSIGGNFGYGKQEDAHEFMRFAIDTMQSVCLDEFGGEKALHPSSQETTLIQHIFGGYLQSQVICTKCNKISNQYENMMDLTVEIQGDAASLEECLDQFTVREWLHGENMYKCDGCNDYVKASKRLSVRRAPNILTIALKRFQSGRFGKLNKRVSFPETLDLSPYMSELGDGTDVYKLYAVVVHVDMLNASYFGHYICYIKDFRGNWYRIDDCKVMCVELEEVLSQGAYMLLYSRICARPSCLNTIEHREKELQMVKVEEEAESCSNPSAECSAIVESSSPNRVSEFLPSISNLQLNDLSQKAVDSDAEREKPEDPDVVFTTGLVVSKDIELCDEGNCNAEVVSPVEHAHRLVSGLVSSSKVYSTGQNLMCQSSSHDGVSSFAEVKFCNSTETSLPSHIGGHENGGTFHEDSVAALNTDKKILIEKDPGSAESLTHITVEKLEKVKSSQNCPTSNNSNEDAVVQLAGENSSTGANLKPLFSPGFLRKRPRNKFVKRDGNSFVEHGGCASACNLNCICNGFSAPGCHHQINGGIKDQTLAHLDSHGLSPSTSMVERPDMVNNANLVESANLRYGVASYSTSSGHATSDGNGDALCRTSKDHLIHYGSPCFSDVPGSEHSVTSDEGVCERGTLNRF